MPDLITIQPNELRFRLEVKKQATCSLQLKNAGDGFVAFKVKTTAPKKYCVRPNAGVIEPRGSCDVAFTMQAQRESAIDLQCKDKFLIQSTGVEKGAEINPELFDKELNSELSETKLKVLYLPGKSSPDASSPTPSSSSPQTQGSDQDKLAALRGKVEQKSSPSKGSSSATSGVRAPDSSPGVNRFSIVFVIIVALVGVLLVYVKS